VYILVLDQVHLQNYSDIGLFTSSFLAHCASHRHQITYRHVPQGHQWMVPVHMDSGNAVLCGPYLLQYSKQYVITSMVI